jgi:hypothetical protein
MFRLVSAVQHSLVLLLSCAFPPLVKLEISTLASSDCGSVAATAVAPWSRGVDVTFPSFLGFVH